MSAWRITGENPARELEGIDYERNAALHNHIVELGWLQRGLAPEALDKRTWWECYESDIDLATVLERLNEDIVCFLKLAWHGFAMETSTPSHSFHRYLHRLCSPDELWENVMYDDEEDDSNKRRFVTLYRANWGLNVTHPLGLVVDQEISRAMQHMSISNSDVTMNGRQVWPPLEYILDDFIDMIDQRKVVAVPDAYEPWIMPSYTNLDLDETLQAFQELVHAIHTKMPSHSQGTGEPLLESVTGDLLQSLPSNSFAHQFLARSPRPSFTNIAPGLRITQHQPFSSISLQEGSEKKYPLLLFSSTHLAHQEVRQSPWGEEIPISSFNGDFYVITTHPAGLYLTEIESHPARPFEDGCRLVLPFPLGANAYARTSDDALIGEFVQKAGEDATADLAPTSTDLYQQGYNHSIARHDVQLKHVLWRWAEMVQEGKWEVDDEGVMGGIEKWKEADTEEGWVDYQLPMRW